MEVADGRVAVAFFRYPRRFIVTWLVGWCQIVRCPDFVFVLLQTVELTVRLPAADSSNLGSATIRVLVVDPEGLVTIYSPVLPSESASPTGSDVISKVMAGHRKKINTEVTPTSTKSPAAVSRVLNGRGLSRRTFVEISVSVSCFSIKLVVRGSSERCL